MEKRLARRGDGFLFCKKAACQEFSIAIYLIPIRVVSEVDRVLFTGWYLIKRRIRANARGIVRTVHSMLVELSVTAYKRYINQL
jgi:hypothetical protein